MQSYFQNNDQMQYQRLLLHIQFYILLLLFPLFSSLTLITSSKIILCHSFQMTTVLTLMGLTY